MPNIGSSQSQNQTFNMSKFWAFRLINAVSFLSIFLLLSILLIPIPYFYKEREPHIVDLNLNVSGYSHAIKITTKKLPGKIVSVSFSTHNSDHIIGSTFFGDIKLNRDPEYLSRFVNCHYKEKRKGLPFRVVVIDAYPKLFILKRFILQDYSEPTYKSIEASVYMISDDTEPEVLNTSIDDLLEEVPDNVYRMQYEDTNEKVVTHYFPNISHTLGNIRLGYIHDDLPEGAIYRNVTTVLIKSLEAMKVVLTTFYLDDPKPRYREYYCSLNDADVIHRTVEEFSKHHGFNLTKENFEVNRHESKKINTIYFNSEKHKNEGLLNFEYKYEKHKYEIVLGDKKDTIVDISKKVHETEESETVEKPLDRFMVIEYDTKEPKPPNYYIWDRMLYFNRLTILNHL